MTPMDPRARVGDADREQAVAELQRYVTDGYLTLEEFSDRSAAAYRATTYGELVALTEDLAPRAQPDRNRSLADRVTRRGSWSPVVIAVTVLVGVVLLAAVVMVVMMLAMMGGGMMR